MSQSSRMQHDASAAAGEILTVSDLGVRFGGIVALDGVSFGVAPQQVVGLIGPNGAGKTTLFNCLSRLYAWERGSVTFGGRPLAQAAPHEIAGLGMGRTFQSPALFGSMTVLDNVMVGRHCRTRSGFVSNALRLPRVAAEERASEARAREMVRLLGLDPVAGLPVAGLPVATRKRVELARALAGEPRLLLLDEPAAGLNHEEVQELGHLVRDVRDRLHLTVLLVEHHMGLVMSLSDKVVALNFGRKIAEGAPAEVSRHPDVVAAYLGTAGAGHATARVAA